MATIRMKMRFDCGRYGWHETICISANNTDGAIPKALYLAQLRNKCLIPPCRMSKLTLQDVTQKRRGTSVDISKLETFLYADTAKATPWDGILVRLVQGVWGDIKDPLKNLVAGTRRSYILRGISLNAFTGNAGSGWAPNPVNLCYKNVKDFFDGIVIANSDVTTAGDFMMIGDTKSVAAVDIAPGAGVLAYERDDATGFIKFNAPGIDWTTAGYKKAVISGFTLGSKKYNGRHTILNATANTFMIPEKYDQPPLIISRLNPMARPVTMGGVPIGAWIGLGPAKRDTGIVKHTTKGRYKRRPLLR